MVAEQEGGEISMSDNISFAPSYNHSTTYLQSSYCSTEQFKTTLSLTFSSTTGKGQSDFITNFNSEERTTLPSSCYKNRRGRANCQTKLSQIEQNCLEKCYIPFHRYEPEAGWVSSRHDMPLFLGQNLQTQSGGMNAALISSVDESTVTSQSGRGFDSAAEPVEAGCESPHRVCLVCLVCPVHRSCRLKASPTGGQTENSLHPSCPLFLPSWPAAEATGTVVPTGGVDWWVEGWPLITFINVNSNKRLTVALNGGVVGYF
ncbi:hypothetical protein CCH79_00000633 [Gambusia affinis]|uniref:Uncharacterized protein n=1 Tax=Gambusia affinis TaxID=33528 RepID=A0A315VZ61_GAMAF|nr:hypothetical protein CCH79_00000633 [Gambusia affinis]